jgi:hypothetical protein
MLQQRARHVRVQAEKHPASSRHRCSANSGRRSSCSYSWDINLLLLPLLGLLLDIFYLQPRGCTRGGPCCRRYCCCCWCRSCPRLGPLGCLAAAAIRAVRGALDARQRRLAAARRWRRLGLGCCCCRRRWRHGCRSGGTAVLLLLGLRPHPGGQLALQQVAHGNVLPLPPLVKLFDLVGKLVDRLRQVNLALRDDH